MAGMSAMIYGSESAKYAEARGELRTGDMRINSDRTVDGWHNGWYVLKTIRHTPDPSRTLAPTEQTPSREDYTWEMCVRDLALTTHLNSDQAFELTYLLRGDFNPYDSFPILQRIAECMDSMLTREQVAQFSVALQAFQGLGRD